MRAAWKKCIILLGVGWATACLIISTAQAQDDAHTTAHGITESGGTAPAVVPEFNAERAFIVSQQAIGRKLSTYQLTDSTGRTVSFGDYIGQPIVINMVYTSCHHICPTLTKHLANVVAIGRDALGQDAFTVFTVGFDTAADTPQQMAMFAAQRGIQDPRWHFVSADESSIQALSAELGFLYQSSPRGFDHITQTTVIDGAGVIRNQVYGVKFDPPLLIEPLKHTLRGQVFAADTVEGWWRDIKLLCTVYDPASGRYHFDYSLIVALIMGLACLSIVAVFILRAWRSSRRLGITP